VLPGCAKEVLVPPSPVTLLLLPSPSPLLHPSLELLPLLL
jgi:hypothetical protein